MPAHKKEIEFDAQTIRFFNLVTRHLSLQHFFQVPHIDVTQNTVFASQFSTGDKSIVGFDSNPSITYFLQFLDGLTHKLLTFDASLQCTWNYLGTPEVKKHYLEYLETTFWSVQNENTIQKSPLLAAMTEHPWKVAGVLATMEGEWQKPTDFFDDASREFELKITQSLAHLWRKDPFLVVDPEGAFEWKILCAKFTLTGYIQRHEHQLFHSFSIKW